MAPSFSLDLPNNLPPFPSLMLLLLGFVISLVLVRHGRKKSKEEKLPPGPKGLPLIGNLHHLGRSPHIALQELSRKHGPLMFLKLGFAPTIAVSSADIAKEIFKNHDLAFSNRPISYAAKRVSYGCSSVAFSPYGEYWRQVRKISMLELLSTKRVESFRAVREEELGFFIASITDSSSFGSVNLSEKTLSLVNNVVCRVVFGKKYADSGREYGKSRFHENIHEIQALLGGFNVADFFPNMEWFNTLTGVRGRVEKNLQELDNLYELVIKEHLESDRQMDAEHEDLVDVLLRVQRDPSHGITMTSDHIKGILTDMFIAGTDTSSSLMVWTMTELVRNPNVMKKAQKEVRKVVGEKERADEGDLHQLHYLKLVVKEALRLHPPVQLISRETIEKCTVGGYEIPAKTMVLVSARAIQMDPNYWEDPEEFQPERFLNKPIDFRGQDFDLLPFGFGRRGCPGINFSSVIVELALANLLQCFDWDLPHGMRREDLDMEESVGLTMHKKTPLCLVAIPKSHTSF